MRNFFLIWPRKLYVEIFSSFVINQLRITFQLVSMQRFFLFFFLSFQSQFNTFILIFK